MKKYLVIILTILVISSLFLSACGTDVQNAQSNALVDIETVTTTETSESTITTSPSPSPSPAASITPVTTPKETNTVEPLPSTSNDKVLLDEKIIKSQILDTGTTLSEIAFLLDEHEDTLLLLHGDGLEWIRNDYKYREYSYRKKGITIGCYSEDYSEYLSKYIELDRDKISFLGITASSDFEDVMNVLGETDVYEIQDGLPELVTYELRYQFDWYSYNYTLRIYSNSKDGSDGVYMSLVAVNDPKYRVIRITTEKISRYFDMTKEELVCKLGEDNDNFYYKQYNAFFTFDEQGKKLIKLGLSGNYQINDIREGFSMDKVMEVMGKRKIYTDQTSEDGPIYYIEYKYDNFILLVEHFFAEGWGTTWTIKSTEYDGLW